MAVAGLDPEINTAIDSTLVTPADALGPASLFALLGLEPGIQWAVLQVEMPSDDLGPALIP